MNRPDVLARSRESVQAWKEAQRAKFDAERHSTYEERVHQELERLVHVFAGPGGLDPGPWRRLPHKLTLVAERNVKRHDKLEKERCELEIWDSPAVVLAATESARAAAKQDDEQQQLEQDKPDQKFSRSSSKWQRSDTMTSKQHRMALDIIGKMAAGKLRVRHRRSSTGFGPANIEYERVRSVAENFKKATAASAAAEQPPSPNSRGYRFGSSPRDRRKPSEERGGRKPEDAQSPGKQGRQGTPEGRPNMFATGTVRKEPSFVSSHRRGSQESRRDSGTGSFLRKSLGSRVKKVEDLGPLAIAYHQASQQAGASYNQVVAEALADTDPSGQLKLTGVVLNAAAASALGQVLTTCHHLTSLHLTRIVMNLAALEVLLPAARTLKIKSLHFLCSNLTPESCPLLVTALSRPTSSLSDPPSEWWLSLRDIDLNGNPLGDAGLTVLLPVLPQLQGLRSLSLQHTSLTDWGCPQIEQLLRTVGQLRHLDLAHNQLGPMSGKAIAVALADCGQLESLDLSWNPLGSSVQHISWALIAPRFEGCFRLKSLSLAGVDLEAEDHMALAAFLHFGIPGVPLEVLDLSHTALVGVSAQCLLRQLNHLQPPHHDPPEPEHEPPPQPTPNSRPPSAMLKRSIAAFTPKSAAQTEGKAQHASSAPHATTPAQRPRSEPPRRSRRAMSEQERLEEEFKEEQARAAQPPTLNSVKLMGCRVDLDGGQPPKPRIKATSFPPRTSQLSGAPGPPQPHLRPSSTSARPMDAEARKRLSFGRSEGLPPLQHFKLDLGTARPDRLVAQLLVQQEMDARLNRLICWYDMTLNGRVMRRNGRDVIPFDVLYEGWHCEDAIPHTGVLELGVACLPEGASPWWTNPRLQFNAAHLLKKREEEARRVKTGV